MNIREIKYGKEQLRLLKGGLDSMANAVKITLGPKGQTVTIQKHGKAKVTKDGVSVAREVALLDQFEDQGAQLALETCMKSNNMAGDGTTTAIVLAQAIMDGGMKAIESGLNPIDIKHGIEMATTQALTHLISLAREVETEEQLLQVGNVSSNGDEQISRVIVEALDKAGKNGMITYQESSNLKTTLSVVSGYHFARGYHSQDYCNVPNKLECVLENALVLITSIRLNYWKAIEPYVALSHQSGMPLLIITDEFEGESRAILLKAVHEGKIRICVVKAPLTGEHRDQVMEDIAMYTGGEYIRHDKGDKLEFDHTNPEAVEVAMKKLGKVKRVVVGRETTTLLGGNRNPERFEEYCDGLYGAQKDEPSVEVRAFLQERLARLSACRAAKEEGILPGGGIALLRVCKMSFDNLNPLNEGQIAGIEIVKQALRVPIRQLAINAGIDPDIIMKKIEEANDPDFGWDVARNICDNMHTLGILDPLKVVRSALEGASSIAALMLGNGCTIVDRVTMQQSGQLSPLSII